MKSASLSEVKKELQLLPVKDLVELCLALAKYKKDNKEYLAYLLFQSHDKTVFLSEVKEEIDLHFTEINPHTNLYYVKKSLRKLLRIISKFSKYLGDKALSAELYIYFCDKVKNSGIPFRKSQQLVNMYEQQLKKINALVATLHEDLQNDYLNELEKIKI
ncbi:MAG: hypothetical protein V4635_03870 [Bacteroidota bacterium]